MRLAEGETYRRVGVRGVLAYLSVQRLTFFYRAHPRRRRAPIGRLLVCVAADKRRTPNVERRREPAFLSSIYFS